MAFLDTFGHYLPERVVTNAEVAARLAIDEAWIVASSGIRERRFAADGETVEDMAVSAARDCLGGERSVGLILVSSGTSGRRFPGPAAIVGARLELSGVPAIDVPVASAGSIFALALADSLAPVYGNVLVVAAEKMSPAVWTEAPDKNTAILFGDGAGACLVRPDRGRARIVSSVLHSDGAQADELSLPLDGPLRMNGMAVIMHASRKLPRVIEEAAAKAGIAAGGLDAILLHQANQNLLEKTGKALGLDPARVFSNVARYGNTSSASLLIAAAEWQRGVGFSPGRPVALAGFGAGFHWGALVAEGAA